MNQLIQEVIKEITGLNIRGDNDRIRVRRYQEGKEETLGHGGSLSEALVKLNDHHWLGGERGNNLGFIYKIVDTKEKMGYIGRKQYLYYNKDKQSYSIDSAWESYCGSCKPLVKAYKERPKDFIFYRILDCKDRDEIGYAEHMIIRGIFESTLVTGELKYYNNVIPKLYRGQLTGVSPEFKEIVHGIESEL